MKKFKLFTSAILVALISLAFISSASAADPNKTEIKLSRSQGAYSELFIDAIKPILEKQGYTVTPVLTSDLLQATMALNDGDVDINVELTLAYILNFNNTQDGDLIPLTKVPGMYASIYPGRKKSLDQVKDGDHIAIPKQATAGARCLHIFEKAGWIKIKKGKNPTTVGVTDIIDNPKNLQFTTLEETNIPTVATDFDYIAMTGSVIYNAKLDPKTAVLVEDLIPEFELVMAIKKENKDTQWAQDLVKAYNSKEFRDYFDKQNTGLWYFNPEN